MDEDTLRVKSLDQTANFCCSTCHLQRIYRNLPDLRSNKGETGLPGRSPYSFFYQCALKHTLYLSHTHTSTPLPLSFYYSLSFLLSLSLSLSLSYSSISLYLSFYNSHSNTHTHTQILRARKANNILGGLAGRSRQQRLFPKSTAAFFCSFSFHEIFF